MDIKKIISLQNEFDKNHGWSFDSKNYSELIYWLHKDLIGIFGELGEFSNLLKKVTLLKDKPNSEESKKLFNELKDNFSEELIDSFIYLIRIANYLDIDIEQSYLKKLQVNEKKYKDYE